MVGYIELWREVPVIKRRKREGVEGLWVVKGEGKMGCRWLKEDFTD